MANRKPKVYDSGATSDGFTEAEIVMDWANELRTILMERGHFVVRTRTDAKDPAPVARRTSIAKDYGCEVMVSLHCNAFNGTASGTETFYRGESNAPTATKLNSVVVGALSTVNRGIKTEGQSQHSKLAVLTFPRCWLIELGFIDHPGDRAKMLNPTLRKDACMRIAYALVG